MKSITNILYVFLLVAMTFAFQACDNNNTSDMQLDGDTRIETIKINGFSGIIDQKAKVVSVNVSTDVDLENLCIDEITLSRGATCDYPVGTKFDGTVPRSIKVVNGNVFSAYTVSVKHDNVEFLTFTLDGKYSGSIDNFARTIQCFVPMEA
ncbi:MAG: hypothetical protein K2H60_10420, partial [Muribaculaceae bacterium]|nr:hypothetical protein [Muribaculaceae bacterium]